MKREANSYVRNRKKGFIPIPEEKPDPIKSVPKNIKEMLGADDMDMISLGVTICETKYRIRLASAYIKYVNDSFEVYYSKPDRALRVREKLMWDNVTLSSGLWQQLTTCKARQTGYTIYTGRGGLV